MTDLLSMSLEELTEWVKAQGYPAFRAKQLYAWILRGVDFPQMSNLPRELRDALSEIAIANPVSIEKVVTSHLDDTRKFLYRLPDGNLIEGVLMRYKHGHTMCLSTQAGCRMGCAFCASTIGGLARDLTPGEMLGQIVAVNALLGDAGKVGNAVLMGSGEPLDNYENTVKFLRLMSDERGLNLSLRGVSLSTCGLAPAMRRLAEEGLPVTLCLSLHAPNDEIRKTLMPVAAAYPIEDAIDACRYYVQRTGRRAIFEYALIAGVNDAPEHADELSRRLRGLQCHVNVIPLNEIPERGLRAPDEKTIAAFLRRLEARHLSATRRREMGEDIQGACGQLRGSALAAESGE